MAKPLSTRTTHELIEILSRSLETEAEAEVAREHDAPRPPGRSLVGSFAEGVLEGTRGTVVVGTLGLTCGATFGWLSAPDGRSPADRIAAIIAHVILFGLLGVVVAAAAYALVASVQAMFVVLRQSKLVGLPLVAFVAWAGRFVWGVIDGSPLVPSFSDPPVKLLFLGGLLLFAAAIGVFVPTALAGVLVVALARRE